MKRLLVTSVVIGLIAGLLVGGFHNLFTVPVMERAIVLEEERSATQPAAPADPAAPAVESPSTEVSLGVQRLGMTLGTGIYGAIIGLFFSVGFVLLHRAAPSWPVIWVALTVGALGFWSMSLFPFIKYPLNPPGVGDGDTLVARQLGQTLFMLVSALAVGLALDVLCRINENVRVVSTRLAGYATILAAYAGIALAIVFSFPGNPDPVPVPIDLLELFRTLTMVGHYLTWTLLAVGVALALIWHERSRSEQVRGPAPAAGVLQ